MNDRRNSFFRLFLLILLCLGVQSLRAQTVTKVFKNEPLKAVLKEVERQTKYSIIYKSKKADYFCFFVSTGFIYSDHWNIG